MLRTEDKQQEQSQNLDPKSKAADRSVRPTFLETKVRKSGRGYLYIAAATFCWGVAASLGRAAFTGRLPRMQALRPIDPLILSQSRVTFSFLVLLPLLWLIRRNRLRLPAADVG